MPAEHDSRVPIVVGVTGHRDLSGGASKEVLRREVDEAMDRLRGRYPHSPFVVLSPLAEGADRLVARAALERLGASLLVPLPLPEALYRQDFPSDAAQEDFDALLEAAGGVFELPLLSPRDEVAAHGLARNRQYALAGGFVADRAQVVFALWDGEDAAGTGGTGQVARWALQGHVPTECLPPEAKDRPFYYPSETDLVHVHTETGETRYRTGDSPAAPVLKRLDRYNEEVQALAGGAGGRRDVERSVDRVAGEAGPGAFDGGAEQGILARYGAADALSVRLQSRFKRRLRGIYALSAAGVLGFASIEVWAPAIALSVLFVALGLGLLWGLQREELEDRYLHARALAEGLRVGLFWTSAGVAHHVHDHYLGKQAGEMAWTRIALQNVETATRTPHIASRDTAAGPPGGRREERAAHAANGTSDGAAPATSNTTKKRARQLVEETAGSIGSPRRHTPRRSCWQQGPSGTWRSCPGGGRRRSSTSAWASRSPWRWACPCRPTGRSWASRPWSATTKPRASSSRTPAVPWSREKSRARCCGAWAARRCWRTATGSG
jgi:hypothetical protein